LEEALDLSFDRLLMMMMMNPMVAASFSCTKQPYVLENVKGKLNGCSHTYNYKIYGRDLNLTKSIC
jgi:hypothetical protein